MYLATLKNKCIWDFWYVYLFNLKTQIFVVIQDLTGLESMDQCRRTLEQHNWNIEVRAGKPHTDPSILLLVTLLELATWL